MKYLLFACFFISSVQLFAQDTTWVQTFTFDSITARRANFQFPASLDTERFEKVQMYYKLKCSPLTNTIAASGITSPTHVSLTTPAN
jgi:hypothetical protein